MTAVVLATVVLAALYLAAAAQAAITYAPGTALETSPVTTSVAVDQGSGDLYVASGGTLLVTSGEGRLRRFSSAGAELACTPAPVVEHPGGLAVVPGSGTLYSVNVSPTATSSELRAYGSGCGAEIAPTTGEADTTSGSTELTNVSTDHPLSVGEAVEGPGIATAIGAGDLESGSSLIKNFSGAGGFAVGQRITGVGIKNNVTVSAVLSPTEVEISKTANGEARAGAPILARTRVASIAGTTVTLDAPASATASGVSITATAWNVETSTAFPVAQPAADAAGDLYWPNKGLGELQKFSPAGEEVTSGSFPVALNQPSAVALDARGNIFVVGGEATSCFAVTEMELKKLGPEGEELTEAGPVGPGSVFAGVASDVSSVAVDQGTGNVYVGRGCGETFRVEEYGPGGGKLAEFGSGLFSKAFSSAFVNQLAVNETTGTVYAADPGHEKVQVFEDSSATNTLSTSVSPTGAGEVQCNGTGASCLSDYDEGQEVIVEAVESNPAYAFKEWKNGTGSAAACDGKTASSCTFTLEADSTIEAAYVASGPPLALTVNHGGTGSGTVECDTGSGPEACAAEYPEGTSVTLVDTPGTNSHFVEWIGCDAVSGTSCEVTMTEAKTVEVVNDANPKFALTVNHGGTGSGTVECDTGSGPGACAAEYPEGTTVTLTDTPASGSHFVEWIGCDAVSGTSCEVTMTEAKTVEAVNDLTSKSLLTVFVTGHGSVSADSGTISGCTETGGTACEGEYEGTVTLTGTPESSTYVLAGWLGCRRATADTCEVTVDEAEEVTAVFLTEGTPGTPGSPGKNVVLTPITNAGLEGHCVGTGGVRVEVEGESATRRYICNGEEGLQGEEGEQGIPGTPGAPGPQGATGAQGPPGPNGATGSGGAAGPQGAIGPQGPAGKNGKNAKVTCKVKQKKGGKKVKVTCTVKYKGGKAKGSTVSWRLTKGGHVAGHGRTTLRRLNRVLDRLRPGRYVLHVGGRGTPIVVPSARHSHTRHHG